MTRMTLADEKGLKSAPKTGPFRLLTFKMLLAIWLGIPLLASLGFCNGSEELHRNVSVYTQALIKPRYTVSGIIDRPDPRGRHLSLKSSHGEQRIFCDLGMSQSNCLFGRKFPINSKVTLFNYSLDGVDYPVIISVVSEGNYILSEARQINSLKESERRAKYSNRSKDILGGFSFGIILSLLTTFIMITIGWSVKVRIERVN